MVDTEIMGLETSNASVLHRVSGIVSSPLSLDEMLGEIVGLAARVAGCDACLVYLAEAESGEFVLRASLLPHASDLGQLRVKMGEGVAGWVAAHGETLIVPESAQDPRLTSEQAGKPKKVRSVIALPLRGRKGTHGVIEIFNPRADRRTI